MEDFAVSTKEPTVYEAKEVAAFAASQFLEGKIDEFHVVYTRMRSIVRLEPTMLTLLPLDVEGHIAGPPRAPSRPRGLTATSRARRASSTPSCRNT